MSYYKSKSLNCDNLPGNFCAYHIPQWYVGDHLASGLCFSGSKDLVNALMFTISAEYPCVGTYRMVPSDVCLLVSIQILGLSFVCALWLLTCSLLSVWGKKMFCSRLEHKKNCNFHLAPSPLLWLSLSPPIPPSYPFFLCPRALGLGDVSCSVVSSPAGRTEVYGQQPQRPTNGVQVSSGADLLLRYQSSLEMTAVPANLSAAACEKHQAKESS